MPPTSGYAILLCISGCLATQFWHPAPITDKNTASIAQSQLPTPTWMPQNGAHVGLRERQVQENNNLSSICAYIADFDDRPVACSNPTYPYCAYPSVAGAMGCCDESFSNCEIFTKCNDFTASEDVACQDDTACLHCSIQQPTCTGIYLRANSTTYSSFQCGVGPPTTMQGDTTYEPTSEATTGSAETTPTIEVELSSVSIHGFSGTPVEEDDPQWPTVSATPVEEPGSGVGSGATNTSAASAVLYLVTFWICLYARTLDI